jgi:hypothetical protein
MEEYKIYQIHPVKFHFVNPIGDLTGFTPVKYKVKGHLTGQAQIIKK